MSIRALIEAVERGSCPLRLLADAGFSGDNTHQSVIIQQAFHGSLDAALALHEALLPGYAWGRQWSGHMWVERVRGPMGSQDRFHGHDKFGKEPARAWLLAILRAVEAEGQQ